MNPQILFCKSQTNCKSKNCRQIQKNILQIRKNILSRVTCAGSLSPSAVCRIQEGGDLCLVFDSCESSRVNPAGDKFCFKSGSKAAEISHQSARISTPEDEHASSFSSTQSLSQYLASKAENAEDINLTSQTTKPVLKGTSTIQDPRSSPVFAKPLHSYRSHGTRQESVQWYLNPLSSK